MAVLQVLSQAEGFQRLLVCILVHQHSCDGNCHLDNQGILCMLINLPLLLNNRGLIMSSGHNGTFAVYSLRIQQELKHAGRGKGVGRIVVGRKNPIPQNSLGSVRAQYKAPLFVPLLLKCLFWWDSPRLLRVKQNFVIFERLSLKILSSWELPSLCSNSTNYYSAY